MTGVGPLIAWRRASLASLSRQFIVPVAAGLAVTLAESCLAGDVGFEATDLDLGARLDGALFGETQSRLIVTVGSAADAEALLALAAVLPPPGSKLPPPSPAPAPCLSRSGSDAG